VERLARNLYLDLAHEEASDMKAAAVLFVAAVVAYAVHAVRGLNRDLDRLYKGSQR